MKKIIVANWKMYFSFDESISFVTTHFDDLLCLLQGHTHDVELIVSPSFPALYPLVKIFKDTNLSIGAQDCASHYRGAFTGQVSAASLKEIGCLYCIIGHSERRKYQHETDTEISEKLQALIDVELSPIVCIGESFSEREENCVLEVLEAQLEPIISLMHQERSKFKKNSICIAYEPIWAIGTGRVVSREQLSQVLEWLHAHLAKRTCGVNWRILYGGSVMPENMAIFSKLAHLDGFLIGNASTDFQSLKKIVDCAKGKI